MTPAQEKKHAELSELLGLLRTHRDEIAQHTDTLYTVLDVEMSVAMLRDELAKGDAP